MGEQKQSHIRVLLMGAALAAVSAVGGALGTASLKWFNDRATGTEVSVLAVKLARIEAQLALGELVPVKERTVNERLLFLEAQRIANVEAHGIEAMDRAAVQAYVEAVVDVGIDSKRRSIVAKAAENAADDVKDKFDASKVPAREAAERAVRYARSRRR